MRLFCSLLLAFFISQDIIAQNQIEDFYDVSFHTVKSSGNYIYCLTSVGTYKLNRMKGTFSIFGPPGHESTIFREIVTSPNDTIYLRKYSRDPIYVFDQTNWTSILEGPYSFSVDNKGNLWKLVQDLKQGHGFISKLTLSWMRYNGNDWITIHKSDRDVNDASNLIYDSSSNSFWTYWINGTIQLSLNDSMEYKNITYYDGNNVYDRINYPDDPNSCSIGPDDRVWFNSENGDLFYFQNNEFHNEYFNHENSRLYATYIFVDHSNTIWTVTPDGLKSYKDGIVTFYGNIPDVLSITEDEDQVLWFGTVQGLYHYDGSEFIQQPTAVETPGNQSPSAYSVIYNHPNPFNPSTTITYTLPEAEHTTLSIYSITGQKIRVLVSDYKQVGTHSVDWDGTDDSGLPASTGVYITLLESGNHKATGKMLLVR